MIAPDVFHTPAGVYLGLRQAQRAPGRRAAATPISSPSPICCGRWRCRLEDGDASQAQRDLRAAEQKLREALERGADDAEMRKLTKELRDAAERYMRDLAAAGRRSADDADAQLTQQDLEVDARPHGGHRAQRRAPGRRGDARPDAEHVREHAQRAQTPRPTRRAAKCASRSASSSKLLRDQQALRDDTFRQDQREAALGRGAPEAARAIRPIRRSRSASAPCATASPSCSGG